MTRRTSADSADTHCGYHTPSAALADEGRGGGAAPAVLAGRCGEAVRGVQQPCDPALRHAT
jgi:hypothetical protein